MNLAENIKEGIRSVKANMLRSTLTAAIVAIGITSLVGILTAVDAIQYSINDSLSELGVNKFEIYSKRLRGSRTEGRTEKVYPIIKYREAQKFVELYNYPAMVAMSTYVSWAVEAKRKSKKTNPNVGIIGGTEDFITLEGLNLEKGRNFSNLEIQNGINVAVVGSNIVKSLFETNEDPLNQSVSFLGQKFVIIGVLEERGSFAGDNTDNAVVVPIIAGQKVAGGRQLRYKIQIGINNPVEIDNAMGEATGLMRTIRQDRLGEDNSFEIDKSETLAQQMEEITGVMRIGGFGVGFVTLLGAAIALMNIMMVSVTERTREVGVRKALGATPQRIRQQFIIEAIVVCIMGGLAGVILGIVIGNVISALMQISGILIPWVWITVGLIVCVVVGLISGYYPAYKASKLDPIDSLRFE